MPVLFYLLVMLARVGVSVWRGERVPKPEPMCTSCSFSHMQYAVGGKRAISCTFAGGMRPITIDVMYCTDYRDRSITPRLVTVGFVRELPEVETMAEAAIADR